MSNFIYDDTDLPDGKVDINPPGDVPAGEVRASEWNTAMQAEYDARAAILAGQYQGLVSTPEVGLSASGHARQRQSGDTLGASVNSGAYHVIASKDPGIYLPESFGAVGDGTTDDSAAFEACITAMGVTPYFPGRIMQLGAKKYRLSRQLDITRTMTLQGVSHAQATAGLSSSGTLLLFDAGTDGIIFHRFNTSYDNGQGDYSVVRDLTVSAAGKTSAHHGVRFYARAALQNVTVSGFAGDGIRIAADVGGTPEPAPPAWAGSTTYKRGVWVQNDGGKNYIAKSITGVSAGSGGPTGTGLFITDGGVTWGYVSGTNANNWSIYNCRSEHNGGNGLYVVGGDSNAGTAFGLDCSSNTGIGIYDSGFLGNTYIGCHTATNAGGSYKTDDASARHVFVGCYSESDQSTGLFSQYTVGIGGLLAAGTSGGYFIDAGVLPTTQFAAGAISLTAGGTETSHTSQILALLGVSGALRLKYYAPGADFARGLVGWNYAGLDGYDGNGFAAIDALYDSGTRRRWMPPTQLYTSFGGGHGILNSGQRIEHADDPTTVGIGVNPSFMPGDIIFRATAIDGASPGWMCTVAGTNGTYTEGLTCSSTGGTTLTLSGATGGLHGLHVGDKIKVNGTTTVTIHDVATDYLSLTVSGSVPSGGPGLSIAYVNPTFSLIGNGTSTFNVKDYGAVGNNSTDDSPAFEAAIAAMGSGIWPTPSNGGILFVPRGVYRLSRTLHISKPMVLQGVGRGTGYDSAPGSALIFDAGIDGVVVDRYNTSPNLSAGDYSIIRDIGISASGKTATAHGLRLRARSSIQNVTVGNFKGNGIHIVADVNGNVDPAFPAWAAGHDYIVGDSVTNDSGKWYICKIAGRSAGSGGPTGTSLTIVDNTVTWGYVQGTNCNNWLISNCRSASNGGHGLFTDGGDSNAGVATGLDCSSNLGWGIYDSSFLGNTYIGCHTASNSTGAYKTDGASARNVLNGCYSESDQNPSSFAGSTTVIGGIHAAGFTDDNWGGFVDGRMPSATYQLYSGEQMFLTGSEHTPGGNTWQTYLTGSGTFSHRNKFFDSTGIIASDSVMWEYQSIPGYSGSGMAFANGIFRRPYSGQQRTRWMPPTQLFTGTDYGLLNEGQRIAHNDDPTYANVFRTWLQGDIMFNQTMAAGGVAGRVCVASGSNGSYVEGLMATTNGTTTVVLNGITNTLTGIHVGDIVVINGNTRRVDTVATVSGATNLTVSSSIGAGGPYAITFSPATFAEFGKISGGAGDSTGSPGDATLNTQKGRSAFKAVGSGGTSALTITNSKCTTSSIVMAILQTVDATCTQVLNVVPGNGSFVINSNAAATATCNVAWFIEE